MTSFWLWYGKTRLHVKAKTSYAVVVACNICPFIIRATDIRIMLKNQQSWRERLLGIVEANKWKRCWATEIAAAVDSCTFQVARYLQNMRNIEMLCDLSRPVAYSTIKGCCLMYCANTGICPTYITDIVYLCRFSAQRPSDVAMEGDRPPNHQRKKLVILKNENLPSASLHQLENSTSLCEVLPFCLSICCKHLSYLLLVWYLCVFFEILMAISFTLWPRSSCGSLHEISFFPIFRNY